MGIPSYFSHITRKYGKIMKTLDFYKKEGIHIDNLAMDCNSIIYDIIRKLDIDDNFEQNLIIEVIKKIEDYIQEIKPSNYIFIAFDGVAPLAKMNQQKTRRYKSEFTSKNTFLNTQKSLWSTTNITPGTKFMEKLSVNINHHFKYNHIKYNVKDIIVSCSDEVGEGEHKLFQYLREHPNNEENLFLYGLDADLIMLSIFHIELQKNIFVFREAPAFLKETDSDELYTLNIALLSSSISSEMSLNYPNKNRIYDYAFLCFLLGNDFLPHFPALNIRTHGITVLLDIYNKFIGGYPNRHFIMNNKIQWRWLSIYIKELAKCEHQFILEEYNVRSKQDNKKWFIKTDLDKENIFNSIPIIYKPEEQYICPNEKYWEKRYYFSLFDNSNEPEFKKNLCNNYLEGLEWVFNYYIGNKCSWKWKYNYHYPPLIKDLQEYMPIFETNFLSDYQEPYSSTLQLIYVLPTSKYDLLPEKVHNYLKKNYKQFFNDNYEFKWAFCRYFWECHVDYPCYSVDFLNKLDGEISVL